MNKSLNFAVIGVGLLATMLALYLIAASNFAAAQGGNMTGAAGGKAANMTGAAGRQGQHDWCCRRRQCDQHD